MTAPIVASMFVWFGLVAALVYLALVDDGPSPVRSILKTVPLVTFAAAALIAGGPILLVVSLALSALGDLALSRHGERAFLAGLGAFALAHVAYIVLFVAQAPPGAGLNILHQLPVALALLALAGSVELWLIPHAGRLALPVRVYIVLITLMGLTALLHPMGALAGGALLFILSDLVLAIQLFRMDELDPARRSPDGWSGCSTSRVRS